MKSQGKRAISMLNRPLSLRKLLHEEWTVEHHFMRPTVNNWSWRWNQSQIRHLQDWKFVSRIYKRFSLLGKPLFFQMKTFAILPMEKKNWQSMPIFVGNDNRIALQYIERMVLMESRFNYQPLLLLPQRLKGFSRLRQINYAFTFSRKTTRDFFDWVIQSKVRRKAPAEMLDLFRILGVKVDELDIGIIEVVIYPVDKFESVIHYPCIRDLRWCLWSVQIEGG